MLKARKQKKIECFVSHHNSNNTDNFQFDETINGVTIKFKIDVKQLNYCGWQSQLS